MKMSKFLRHSRKAFTLAEMMIVLTIIGLLMVIGFLPYREYMKQATLKNNVDFLVQEWVLSHKEIRNGLETTNQNNETKHASILWHFEKNSQKITQYLVAGTGGTFPSDTLSLQTKKIITLEDDIKIQNIINPENSQEELNDLYYFIEPPYAEWKFYKTLGDYNNFLKNTGNTTTAKQAKIKIEYDNSPSNLVRWEIILRSYLQ